MSTSLAIVPACLHIDVEPDGFQTPRRGPAAWTGVDAMLRFVRGWKDDVVRAGGTRPRVAWFLRMDPQIEALCGRMDAVATRYAREFAAQREDGDEFGVHLHPLRWSVRHDAWVHDLSDPAWLRHAVAGALDAFEACHRAPARAFRAGAGFLTEDVVDVLDRRGVDAEWSLEPMAKPARYTRVVATGVDSSPVLGDALDCALAPREPYQPAPGDFRVPGGADARRVVLVPVTTAPRRLPPTGLGLHLRRLVGRPPKPRSTRVLYPSGEWPRGRHVWDFAAHRVAGMARPYLSLGVRTDAPQSVPARRVQAVLSALSSHPLLPQLRFVAPAEALLAIAPAHATATRAVS